MKVIRPKLSGFCPGVKFAEKKILERRNLSDTPIFVLGQLIHNSRYIRRLQEKGIDSVDTTQNLPSNSKIVIRTHGIDKNIESKIKKQFEIIDLTCTKVKNLQLFIQKHSDLEYFIIICGKKNHPEVLGLVSYAENFEVIEKREDLSLQALRERLSEKDYRGVMVISQTTGDYGLFKWVSDTLKEGLDNTLIETHNSICPVTHNKEEDALRLQKQAEITFVVGDKKSSNANKLYQILKKNSPDVYFVEDWDELSGLGLNLGEYKTALVVASASTPFFVEREIIASLEQI
jgi:4-hydroxy-3-methylbut-2-enyl diphosphate reductase